MRRARHLVFTLRAGEAPSHVPCHLDHLIGAGRPVQRLDGGPVDAALRVGGGYRALGIYHAAASLGRAGEQAQGWNDLEQHTGLARTYTVELADDASEARVLDALRSVRTVESAAHQTFAITPQRQSPRRRRARCRKPPGTPTTESTPARRMRSSRATSG